MAEVAQFCFNDELIEALWGRRDHDACGVMLECYDETCECYLLGRNDQPIEIYGSDERGWGFRGDGKVVRYPTRDEAVRANQDMLTRQFNGS